MEAASGEQDSDTLLEHSCDHTHEKKPLIYALVSIHYDPPPRCGTHRILQVLTLVFTAAELVAALVANRCMYCAGIVAADWCLWQSPACDGHSASLRGCGSHRSCTGSFGTEQPANIQHPESHFH